MYTRCMFLIFSFSWNRLPTAMSSSMSTATNTTLPLSSPASLSQTGSSLPHGLHQSAPTVTTTHLPLSALSLNGLPLPSTATSSSASRSPTLSTSARAEGAVAATAANTRAAARIRMAFGRIDRLSIHRELFVDPHLDVLGMHRAFIFAVVEEQRRRRIDPRHLTLLEVGRHLRRGRLERLLELRHVEPELLGVAH